METAARQHWDLAILFLNNIKYLSGDRTSDGLIRDARNLIRKMKQLFGRPIICFYGGDLTASRRISLRDAGAKEVFPVPVRSDDVIVVLKELLGEVRGL